MTVQTELAGDIPDTIKPVAETWATALNATFDLLFKDPDHGGITPEHAHELFHLILQTAAAVFGPGEYDAAGQEGVVRMFRDELTAVCDQYLSDKQSFHEGRGNLQ